MIDAVRDFRERFHGYFMLDPTQPGAVERVESAIAGGLAGRLFLSGDASVFHS